MQKTYGKKLDLCNYMSYNTIKYRLIMGDLQMITPTKEEILTTFFSTFNKENVDIINNVKDMIAIYTENNSDEIDPEVLAVDRLVKLLQMKDTSSFNFYKGCQLLLPIFEEFENKKKWSLTEIRLLGSALSNHLDYKKACALADLLLKALEKHKKQPNYAKTKAAISYNVMITLMNTKFEDPYVWKQNPWALEQYHKFSLICVQGLARLRQPRRSKPNSDYNHYLLILDAQHAFIGDSFKSATESMYRLRDRHRASFDIILAEYKAYILSTFFNTSSKVDTEAIKKVKTMIYTYIEYIAEKMDPELFYLSKLVMLFQMKDTNTTNFYPACQLLVPLFAEFENKESWSFIEIRLLGTALSNHFYPRKACKLADRLLEALESHQEHPSYTKIKMGICYNVMLTTMHAKFEDQYTWQQNTWLHEQYNKFSKICLEALEKLDMPVFSHMVRTRTALLLDDFEKAKEEMLKLKPLPKGVKYYDIIVEEYLTHLNLAAQTEKYLTYEVKLD